MSNRRRTASAAARAGAADRAVCNRFEAAWQSGAAAAARGLPRRLGRGRSGGAAPRAGRCWTWTTAAAGQPCTTSGLPRPLPRPRAAAWLARSLGRRAPSPAAHTPPTAAGPVDDASGTAPPTGPRVSRRLRAAGGDRPRRHGRRLPGAAGEPQPRRGPEDDPGRAARRRRGTCSASAPRPRPPPASTTPTSCRSTRSASTTASTTSA